MLRRINTIGAFIILGAASLSARPAQKDPDDDTKKEKTLEEAIDEATLRISERVNVVGSVKALETIPGSAYVLEGEALEH